MGGRVVWGAVAAMLAIVSSGIGVEARARTGADFGTTPPVFGPASPAEPQRVGVRPPSAADAERVGRRLLDGRLVDTDSQAARLVSEASAGSVSGVRALLDAGVDPGAVSESGRSALAEAVRYDHPRVVRLLLERGADPDRSASRGQSPVSIAIVRGRDDLLELLLRADPSLNRPDASRLTPIALAAGLDRPDTVERLWRAGADLEQGGRDGPPLLACARTGALAACERLLALGADPAAADASGRDALLVATLRRDRPLARLLLSRGATPGAIDIAWLAE